MVLFIAVAKWSLVGLGGGTTATEETGEEKAANGALVFPKEEEVKDGVEHPGNLPFNSLSAKVGRCSFH